MALRWTSDSIVSTPGNTSHHCRSRKKHPGTHSLDNSQVSRLLPFIGPDLESIPPSTQMDRQQLVCSHPPKYSTTNTGKQPLLHLPAKGLSFQQPFFSSPELILASLLLRGRTEIVCLGTRLQTRALALPHKTPQL